jgi:hypothetical protein
VVEAWQEHKIDDIPHIFFNATGEIQNETGRIWDISAADIGKSSDWCGEKLPRESLLLLHNIKVGLSLIKGQNGDCIFGKGKCGTARSRVYA